MARNGNDNIREGMAANTAERTAAMDALGRQSALIDLSYEPIFVWDWDAGIIQWNTGAERLYGFTRTEVFGKASHRVLNTVHTRPFEEYLKTLETKGYWAGELRHVTKDRREVIVESRQQIVVSEGRRLVLESNRDITERKLAESISDRYRLLSERSTDVIWFMRPDGNFVDVNTAAIETYGYTRDEFLALNIHDIRHPSTHRELEKQLDSANTADIYFETLHIRKGGSALPVEVKANGADLGGERLIMAIVRDISERKLSDAALRRSEELFSRFMQHLPGLAWIKDPVGRYIYANEAAEKAFQTPREKLYGKRDDEVFPADIAAQFRENDQLALDEGTGLQTVETLEQDDGVLHHSLVSKFPISDADGRTRLIGGMAIDITDRIKAEEALRESEERRQLAQEAGNVGIFDWDIVAGKTYWSETMWAFYGEKPSAVNPDEQYWSSHLHDNDRERVKLNIRHIVGSDGDEFRDEFRIVRNDGSVRWIEAKAKVLRDASGIATRMYGVNIDISTRKEGEERVRLSENQLRLVTNAVPALISYIDNNGRYRFVNQKYTEWFGTTRDRIVGMKVTDVLGPNAVATVKANIEKVLSGEEVTYEAELDYKNVGRRYVRVSYVPDFDFDGSVSGFYALVSDLSDLKRVQDSLQQAHDELEIRVEERTKELAEANAALVQEMLEREIAENQRIDLLRRLVSSQEFERRRIARDLHDQLGQRMTALRLKIASLHELTDDPEQFAVRVDRLQEIAERIDSEVSFLAWELRPTTLDELGLLDAVAAFVTEWSRHYEISADFHSLGLSNARLDSEIETHLYRITQEALNNTAKHAGAKNVTVLLEKRAESVILIVEDDGSGFDPAEKTAISDSSKGLGLIGMTERAVLVGGDVEIESAPGKGTTIYVRVPFST